ncbi:transmembrane protein, putative [Medicago truncatula]|uniref:Transmembrane protein, putative n=1 Tax=Medicago truncatula TaxID=3880 RepID=A0A072UVW9_MEDTR|nr:transmembrane protein, putative [Medicago truncatula]
MVYWAFAIVTYWTMSLCVKKSITVLSWEIYLTGLVGMMVFGVQREWFAVGCNGWLRVGEIYPTETVSDRSPAHTYKFELEEE